MLDKPLINIGPARTSVHNGDHGRVILVSVYTMATTATSSSSQCTQWPRRRLSVHNGDHSCVVVVVSVHNGRVVLASVYTVAVSSSPQCTQWLRRPRLSVNNGRVVLV